MIRRNVRTGVVGFGGLLVLAAHASAGPVSGIVRTETRPGVVPASAIVYAEPLDAPPARRPGTFTQLQKQRTFQPHVLAVPVGSTVEFPNQDPIFHNVFSLSGPQPFDLGLYRSGQTRTRTFTQPGTYRVFCNIHPRMSALIVVVATPHVTTTGRDGRYSLDLPAGAWRVTALSERAVPASVQVVAGAGAVQAPLLQLDETRWVEVQHKNKYGQEYPAAAYTR